MKSQAVLRRIARRIGVDEGLVAKVASEVFNEICAVLETEEPVVIAGFGRFYFRYTKVAPESTIVKKRVEFEAIGHAKELLETRVQSLGIKASNKRALSHANLLPEEIPKLRAALNAASVERHVKVRKLTGEITLAEIASSLSYAIRELKEPD